MRDGKAIIRVSGMHCGHCAQSVHNAIQNMDDVKLVKVDLEDKKIMIKHNNDMDLEFEFEDIEK